MKLEAVGRVSMGNMRFEVCRQIDNVNSSKWALLWADTTSNAESLGDECDLGFGSNFNAETSASHDGAGFLTFLAAFL
jgi:hypothetical protein